MKSSKQAIREHIKKQRMALSESQKHQAAIGAWLQVINLPEFEKANHIGCYVATRGELETRPILQTILKLGKTSYLPIVKPKESLLAFYRYDLNKKMKLNQYGILEPIPNGTNHIDAQSLDLVLVPLVAFDNECHRLGMGKGYYDRTFAFRKTQKRPLLIGLAYSFQNVFDLPTDPFDIDIDIVVTNQKTYKNPAI